MSNQVDIAAGQRRNFGHALPGALSWASIAFTILGALFFPRIWLVIATVVIAYFMIRMLTTFGFAIYGEKLSARARARDWTLGEDEVGPFGFAPSEVTHIVVVPNYKEPDEILRRTLDALAVQHRASERIIPVLGMEEREPDSRAKGEALAAEYADKFRHVLVSVHPGNIPGEEPGKSSNEAWAAKKVRKAVDELGLNPDHCTITSCDADSLINPAYFSAVAGHFASDEQRHLRFWQAPLFYYNNIWQVPAPIRFTTWLSHAVQVAELANPHYDPLPISTYTLSLNLAERCGWWDPAVIPEDWHSYLNCLFETGEEISTQAIFLPTLSDATDGEGFKDAMVNRFHQVKRHAWGAEDVGYIVGQLTERRSSMRSSTLFRFGQVLHDHVMRVAMWFILVSVYLLMAYYTRLHWYDLGWHASIANNITLLRAMFTLGGLSMAATIVFELWRCPPPDGLSRGRIALEIALLWPLLPLIGFYLGTLPALEAQTRLMFGIPLGYRVTPKFAVSQQTSTSKV
ncbi:MAG: hypothetical protein HGB10_05345 [Coriobacteriia bacterium]|nr:hypothetical protein [Coriobacteriia bacterium]